MCVSFIFFQAEDGIRDADVTGVQTCALPISFHDQADCDGDHQLDHGKSRLTPHAGSHGIGACRCHVRIAMRTMMLTSRRCASGPYRFLPQVAAASPAVGATVLAMPCQATATR